MTKRLVDIDDELLLAAQEAAGQKTIKGAVAIALEHLVTEHRRREQALRDRWDLLGDTLADLQDREVMRRAWS